MTKEEMIDKIIKKGISSKVDMLNYINSYGGGSVYNNQHYILIGKYFEEMWNDNNDIYSQDIDVIEWIHRFIFNKITNE